MTILNILSKDEIQLFEKPPQFSAEERNYFFTLPTWVEDELLRIQTPVNKVGLILQAGYFHATKKFYPKALYRQENSTRAACQYAGLRKYNPAAAQKNYS